jgi:hypothetical protein
MSDSFEFFKNYILSDSNDTVRIQQAEILDKLLTEEFNFDYIECIETGCASGGYDNFGVYLAKYCKDNNGKFSTVDISDDYINKSKILYHDVIGENNNQYVVSDSIKFLQSYNGIPNLVHLDSYDLDLLNPLPSMLHHWLEFEAIQDKMPSGSLLLIDDNFFKGTFVSWYILNNGVHTDTKRIDIDYDIIGKGSLIYHFVKEKESNWELIGNHYVAGPNLKLFFRKK